MESKELVEHLNAKILKINKELSSHGLSQMKLIEEFSMWSCPSFVALIIDSKHKALQMNLEIVIDFNPHFTL